MSKNLQVPERPEPSDAGIMKASVKDDVIPLGNKSTANTTYPVIVFGSFNVRRHFRGAEAAEFFITDAPGSEDYPVWMSKSDIKKNITLFPAHKAELEKGLRHYG